jgi:hypothetical protein
MKRKNEEQTRDKMSHHEYIGTYNIRSEWFEVPHNNSYRAYINGKCDKRTRNVMPWVFVLSDKRDKLLVYDSDTVTLEKDKYYCWLHAMVPFIGFKGDRFMVCLMTDLPEKYECSIVHTEIENDNPLIGWVEGEVY